MKQRKKRAKLLRSKNYQKRILRKCRMFKCRKALLEAVRQLDTAN